MSWGDPFKNAWNSATQAAKDAAHSAAQSASSAYDYAAQKAADAAAYAKQKAIQGAQYAKDKAVQGYDYAKQKAGEARDYARDRTRDAERAVANAGFDGVGAGGEGLRKGYNATSRGVASAYDKTRKALGLGPAGKPVKPCPQPKVADKSVANKSIDGWMMSPQGDGKECVATPPGDTALASAKDKAVLSNSACCEAKRAAGGQPRDIIYVNGILTDAQAHCQTLKNIANQTCARVVGIYNATEGGLIDAAQTGQDRRLVKAAAGGKPLPGADGRNPAVDTLARTVASEVQAGRPPEVWAHSQGGAATSLGLYEANNYLGILGGTRDALSGVKVKSFGSAAPAWVDGPQYEHYVHMNDPVPTMFGLGHDPVGDAAAAGRGAKVIRFGGDVASPAPFDPTAPAKEWLPTNLANHSVDTSYLKMEKQRNGGCP
jgi:hypothetical protein